MTNPHFATAASWKAAHAMLDFQPREPAETAGRQLQSLRIHIRDHRHRELPIGGRTLEAHYGTFVLSQARRSRREARRLALDVSYGTDPQEVQVAGHAARLYEHGPEPEPDDTDGRTPAVVTWSDGELFFLVASGELSTETLVKIAASLGAARSRSGVANQESQE